MREKHAIAGSRSKVASSPERGEAPEARGKRINATRYTEEGNPGNAFANQSSSPGARISSKESSVFPPFLLRSTHPALPSTPYLFFLISFSSAFVWSSSTRYPRPTLPLSIPLPPLETVVGWRLAGRGKMGEGGKGEKRETR